jgi:predicted  nucleic acid-binding Zn-ribbon protein
MDKELDILKTEIVQLRKLVQSLSLRIKDLERDNVRIKHEVRAAKANITSLDSRARGG